MDVPDDLQDLALDVAWERGQRARLAAHPDPRDPDYPLDDCDDHDDDEE